MWERRVYIHCSMYSAHTVSVVYMYIPSLPHPNQERMKEREVTPSCTSLHVLALTNVPSLLAWVVALLVTNDAFQHYYKLMG